MFYLLLSILFSTTTALVLKYSESNKLNRNIVTSVNYVIASIVPLFLLLNSNVDLLFDQSLSLEVLSPIFDNDEKTQILSNQGSFLWSLIIGIINGALYYLGFILIQISIKRNGVGLTGAFSKLGIFIPILFSIFIWNEIPNFFKIIGIILTVFSIFFINKSENGRGFIKSFNFILILLLLVIGFGDFSNKIFEKYAILDYKNFFLFILFFSALIFSSFLTLKDLLINKFKIRKNELIIGISVGIPNLMTSYFLIESFSSFDNTGVVYSIYSAGTILLITLGAVLIFKEKLNRREYTAIGIIILALIMLNV